MASGEQSPGTATPGPDARAYAPFRPVKARWVSLGVGAATVVILTGVALALPPTVPVADRVGLILTGLLVAWFALRQAGVRALPSRSGLTVRNLFLGRELEWAEIVSVRFGPDRPWVQLDLADGDTLSVMAIQRSDGARAQTEARRLATLVAANSRTDRDD
jgi:hypothetical protein